MFGYVRPCAEELKVKEFERFRACYCGLCHELGREYGIPGRSILNYDFVFLTMLLWGGRETCDYTFRRCLPGLFRRRCVCQRAQPLTVSAGYSVILAYWKARDNEDDSRGAKRLAARAVRLFLTRGYKKAAGKYPDFDKSVSSRLAELRELERDGERSLDRSADKFAALLASASDAAEESCRQPLKSLLYHVGRIIYIADAWADLESDLKDRRYNPVAARFSLTSPQAPEEIRESVRETLMGSVSLAVAAFNLLPVSYWTPVTENIVAVGIPKMINDVLAGTFKAAGRGIPKRPSNTGRTETLK